MAQDRMGAVDEIDLPQEFDRPERHAYDDPLTLFHYRFRDIGPRHCAWCRDNLGPSALVRLRGQTLVTLGCRWVAWAGSIYIADQTDASAYRMVFG